MTGAVRIVSLLLLALNKISMMVTSFEGTEGDICWNALEKDNQTGICSEVRKCPWALSRIRLRSQVDLCGFEGKTPLVCCPQSEIRSVHPVNQLSTKRGQAFGEKSIAKCEEFYPRNVNFAYGGIPSLAREFPHMAILGYGSDNNIQWGCGGSLISLQHILTAAHCLNSRSLGSVKFVRLGDLDIKNNSDEAEPQDFTVLKAIRHPNYDPHVVKHDIAVLQLDKNIKWTQYVKPACLHIGNSWESWWDVTASGWGVTEFAGEPSSHLMKVNLQILNNVECRQQYAKSGSKGDIDKETQVCAHSADSTRVMDTCQGDSGGPLQVANYTKEKHFNIIGVTSFGKACGISNSAGIYTRVSHYIPWIETIVWKD